MIYYVEAMCFIGVMHYTPLDTPAWMNGKALIR